METNALENAYWDYKNKYEQKRFHSFYIEHQNDEWFKEKYDPDLSCRWKNERNAFCLKLANKFFEFVNSGSFKNLKLNLREQDEYNKFLKILIYGYNGEKTEFEEKERELRLLATNQNESIIDVSSYPYFGFDPDKLTLFLHQIPKNISRFEILDLVKNLAGFLSISLSEPIINQNYYRYCWVTFDSEKNTQMAYEKLKDYKTSCEYKIKPIKSKSITTKKIRITPPLYDERLSEDLELTESFIKIYDEKRSILNNPLTNNERLCGDKLDINILYLRRVHAFCFYCLEEHEDERALSIKCDTIHLRHYKSLGSRKKENELELNKYEYDWDRNFSRLAILKLEKAIDTKRRVLIIYIN